MVWGDHCISCRDGGHYTTSGDKCVCHQGGSWGCASGDHIQRDMALPYSRNGLRHCLDRFSPNRPVSSQFYDVVTQVPYIVPSDVRPEVLCIFWDDLLLMTSPYVTSRKFSYLIVVKSMYRVLNICASKIISPLIVIPGLTRNPVFESRSLNFWIPAGVYPVLVTGQE